jgi:hypothetical protein
MSVFTWEKEKNYPFKQEKSSSPYLPSSCNSVYIKKKIAPQYYHDLKSL